MSTTTMHFGPEWMRTKHQPPSRAQLPPSPPLANVPASGVSTYSALVSSVPSAQPEKRDDVHPFRYTKEDLLRIYKEGGGKGGLGLEVERWEGVVREAGSEPVGLREMGEAEKKLFAGPLNSDLRRRQSTDYLSPLSTQSIGTDRSRLNHNNTATVTGSPMRERFSALRRRDSADPPPLTIPRKQSQSSLQGPLMSPRDIGLPSPRTRVGYTPSFDGVLNSGESWVSRRRASEASLKPGGGTTRDASGEYQNDGKASEIREVDEESHDAARREQAGNISDVHQSTPSPRLDPPSNNVVTRQPISTDAHNVDVGATRLSVNTNGVNASHSLMGGAINASPPGLPDLASIEWSYKDPSGQVQGPFRADLMQKWYDDGYFAPDLPMKRTHIDTQWILVEELARRSTSDRIFLLPPLPTLPPGLALRTESPLQVYADQNPFNGPYQPAPIRSLRTSTIDSYVGTGSNPSDSPSSSFGAGRFSNGSPDPATFEGRGNHSYMIGEPSRVSGFSTITDPLSNFAGRNGYDPTHEQPLNMRSASYGNLGPGRGALVDGYGYNNQYHQAQGPWQNGINTFDSTNGGRGSTDSLPFTRFGPGPGVVTAHGSVGTHNVRGEHDHSPVYPSPSYGNLSESSNQHQHLAPADDKPHPNYNTYNGLNGMVPGNAGHGQHYVNSPTVPYTAASQAAPMYSNAFGSHVPAVPSNPSLSNQSMGFASAPTQSPWNKIPDIPTPRRPGPFEVAHPTASNTIIAQPVTPSQPSPWGRTSQPSRPSSRTNEPSPWVLASQGVLENDWKEEPGPSSLTFSNVGQHNQQQATTPIDKAAVVIETTNQPDVQASTEPAPSTKIVSNDVSSPTMKTRNKPTPAQGNQPLSTPKLIPSAPQTAEIPSPPPPVSQKPAWSKEDEAKKTKSSGVSLSLREIQEAEEKKAEARKVAERERERAARASAPVGETKEDAQSFTASWGLPTSQAGTRSAVAPREGPNSSSPAASTPPVWTTSVKAPVAKKTMKEIQEEEERRKKLATKETVTVAARRAYAESTNKVTPPIQGSAWTTVGPSGKTTAIVTAPTRPAAVPLVSSVSSGPVATPRANGTTSRPVTASPVVKPTSSTSRLDEQAISPSHEFLKWLNESLKGLNSSVNVEEIMSMLLSFPLDPDPSTVELISDLIYANSTTLDGRRFAAEFVNKRKTDAASRPKGTGVSGKTTTKPISIADVVKATPKPAQQEWGFKVVNKKKKGSRA